MLLVVIIWLPYVVSALNGDGSAGNPYNGILTGNKTFGPGDVYINGHIYTRAYTLTIEPNTTLKIYDGFNIYVEPAGSMIADGSAASTISFTAYATNWGHLYLYGSALSVFDFCIFENGYASSGGALQASQNSNIMVTNSTFISNHSSGYGGAVIVSQSTAEISDCIFENNSAEVYGGALWLDGPGENLLIERCIIRSNSSTARTGGIHFATNAGGTVKNCLIYNNTSVVAGGMSIGGPLEGLLKIINCVIVNNIPNEVIIRNTNCSLQNCIIWGSDQAVYFHYTPTASQLVNCAAQGAYSDVTKVINIEQTFTESFTLNSLNSALNGPNFIDPSAVDYRLACISPCRDKGTSAGTPAPPATDFIGNSRIGQYDIGAFEVQYSRWSGAVDDTWESAGNWEAGLVPATADANIIIPYASIYPVCSELTIGSLGSLTIESGGALTVTGDLTNNGSLTVNSSGTSSSGSLIVDGNSTGSMTYNRYLRPENLYGDRHFLSSPVGGQVIPSFILNNLSKINLAGTEYQIWEWDELTGGWPIVNAGDFISGKGYNIDQNNGSDGLLTFTGQVVNSVSVPATSPYLNGYTPRSSPYDYGLGNPNPIWTSGRDWDNYGGGGWNLLGNPFPAAMDAAEFVSVNSGHFDPNYQALYVYDGTTNQYKYAAMEVPGPIYKEGGFFSDNIQAGQGFFVLAYYDEITFSFTPEMRVHNTDVPILKSSQKDQQWPGILLKVSSDTGESMTTVVFNDEMTVGLDPGYDVGQYGADSDVELYTSLVLADNQVHFARQALPVAGAVQNVIPVGLSSEKGGEVTFSASVVPLRNYKFWLEDRVTGTITNLNAESYTVIIPGNTYGTGRFFVHVSAGRVARQRIATADKIPGLRIWSSRDGKVNIQGSPGDKAICEVYDSFGRKVLEISLTDGEYNSFELPPALKGVCIVRVMAGGGVTTGKIAIL